jgi:hypothetical protein
MMLSQPILVLSDNRVSTGPRKQSVIVSNFDIEMGVMNNGS